MTPKEELRQFMAIHGDDPRVVEALLDMANRMIAGESLDSIAASYGVSLEDIKA